MFCPNCGKDCGSAKFCTRCGNNLSETTVVRSGEGDTLMMPPIGRYNGIYGYMEIRPDSVCFHKQLLMARKTERIIPFTDVMQVVLAQEGDGNDLYFLAVREKRDGYLPIATKENATFDETAITFISQSNGIYFSRAYTFLKQLADQNVIALREARAKELGISQLSEVDLELYYEKYRADRTLAMEALQMDIGISTEDAKKVADYIFHLHGDADLIERRKRELDAAGIAYCPRCMSTSITAQKRGFNYRRAAVAGLVSPASYLIWGGIGAGKLQCFCQKCGYIWEPQINNSNTH